jgi:EAL domain-containing protein (putative c-di-GMP-specific phosphodiesterase class I)
LRAVTAPVRQVRHAVEAGRFVLLYQPVVDARTGHLDGFEAPVHWVRPCQAVLSPGALVGARHESARFADVTDLVLGTACAGATRWPACDGRPLRLRLNVCAAELADPRLVSRVRLALGGSGLSPQQLVLEVAPGELADPVAARRTCDVLGGVGVAISLDAYAADRTALDRIRQLPCSELKLAKVLVRDVVDDPAAARLVGHIVELAGSLGLSVSVDGVECREQLRLLLGPPARTLQGFHLGRPSALPGPGDVLAVDRRAAALIAAAARPLPARPRNFHPIGMRPTHPAPTDSRTCQGSDEPTCGGRLP